LKIQIVLEVGEGLMDQFVEVTIHLENTGDTISQSRDNLVGEVKITSTIMADTNTYLLMLHLILMPPSHKA
jgi:hypothetical protein